MFMGIFVVCVLCSWGSPRLRACICFAGHHATSATLTGCAQSAGRSRQCTVTHEARLPSPWWQSLSWAPIWVELRTSPLPRCSQNSPTLHCSQNPTTSATEALFLGSVVACVPQKSKEDTLLASGTLGLPACPQTSEISWTPQDLLSELNFLSHVLELSRWASAVAATSPDVSCSFSAFPVI